MIVVSDTTPLNYLILIDAARVLPSKRGLIDIEQKIKDLKGSTFRAGEQLYTARIAGTLDPDDGPISSW